MLYDPHNVNKNYNTRRIWVIQKNIEAVENRAQKKEEQREKIKRNNLNK
jgi:hypothetical protein|tara:strand:- start:855 stop:1001 length:147 start_codon:yes stop_codon:yes gene_type:complete